MAPQRLLQMLKPLLLLPVVCFHMICRKNCFILIFCSHCLTILLINIGFSFGGTPAPAPDAKAPAAAAGGMFSYVERPIQLNFVLMYCFAHLFSSDRFFIRWYFGACGRHQNSCCW